VRSAQPAGATLVYRPMLLGNANVFYVDTKSGADAQRQVSYLVELPQGIASINWDSAAEADIPESDLETSPAASASFAAVPSAASQPKSYDGWKKALSDTIYRIGKMEMFRSPALGEKSRPGESERDFRVRLQQLAREQRDAMVEKLRQKYAPKIATIQDRIRRAQQAVEVQQAQSSASKWSTAMTFGATVLGAFFGRKTLSAGNISRAATAARGVGRSMKESSDVTRAEENVGSLQQQQADLEAQLKSETDALETRLDPTTEQLETLALRPKKTDITIKTLALAWAPHWQSGDTDTPAWE